jgi:hypothetical protein
MIEINQLRIAPTQPRVGYEIQACLPRLSNSRTSRWDDFIVRDAAGRVYTVPSVPMDSQYLFPWTVPSDGSSLKPDLRFTGKIKWYTRPVIFGGDASDPTNALWISQAQHMQLVTWWNLKYLELCTGSGAA